MFEIYQYINRREAEVKDIAHLCGGTSFKAISYTSSPCRL